MDRKAKLLSIYSKFSIIFASAGLVALLGVLIYKRKFPFFKNSIEENDGPLRPPNTYLPLPPSTSILHTFPSAAICSDSSECSTIGRDIMLRGGNAVDAALAALFCNGLITMQSMGIGGGFLMNVYIRAENKSFSIIAREAAPQAATEKMFEMIKNPRESTNPLFIAVPGEVMGYGVAFKRFASLEWSELIQPTINICRRGFPLSLHMRDSLRTNAEQVKKDPRLRKSFVNETNGDFYRVGTKILPPSELCQTLHKLSKRGPEDFYNGTLAKLIVKDLKDLGSVITLTDLQTYAVDVQPSEILSLGNDVLLHLTPPVGSGHIVGFVMNILSGYEKLFLSENELTAEGVHRIVEALKFGFVKRWLLEDGYSQELLRNLTSAENAAELRQQIDSMRTFQDPEHYGATQRLSKKKEHGTAHISILAPNGDAVSVTSSINFYFGCGYTGARTGILFNNGMADFTIDGLPNYFDLPAMDTNRIKSARKAMSSMAPTIVTSRKTGDVRLVVGAAGGTKIISALVHLLVRVLWLGDDIKQAIDAARFHHQMLPNILEYEFGVIQATIDQLEAKGHKTSRYNERGTAICGIAQNETAAYANADFRKEGDVRGF